MDSSALIFVALAIAWALYLIPKALEHHEESARSRTVERFSSTMRVLARREPVSARKARLVSAKAAAADRIATPHRERTRVSLRRRRAKAADEIPVLTLTELRARRVAAAKAAKRRLRVLTLILVANAAVAGLAAYGLFEWVWTAVPVGVLAVWLVACRLMVRKEIAVRPVRRIPSESEEKPEAGDNTEEVAAVTVPADSEPSDPNGWDPVPVTLPTYVGKPVASRSVRTIDLDSTGVWSSGRSESDSALVREAGEASGTDQGDEDPQRAVGS